MVQFYERFKRRFSIRLTAREAEIFSRREMLLFPVVGLSVYGGGVVLVLVRRGFAQMWAEAPVLTFMFLMWGVIVALLSLVFLRVCFVARRLAKQNSNGSITS